MQIKITFEKDTDDADCRRVNYVTVVNGRKVYLCEAALGTQANNDEAEDRARRFWGNDVEISYESI